MALTRLRGASWLLAALLAFPFPSCAFEAPLSDTAVREAYFMGQRREGSMAQFFDKYTKYLAPPETGPYISKITFLTPFAQVVEHASQQGDDYSAQKAEIDHSRQGEVVRIVVQMYYTDSYAFSRPPGFWKRFTVRVFDRDKLLIPLNSFVVPNSVCSPEGSCSTTGATYNFEFDPGSFATDTAAVQVTPPEGGVVTVSFDLSAFR
jgi:hypothetical protein